MDSPPHSSDTAYALLSRGVQKRLYEMGWPSLRPLQVRAIHALLEDREKFPHLVLAARTAAGKTEAAFLPILSDIAGPEGDAAETGGVRAMYCGPLKALINDQFGRMERLCEEMHLPVHRWHGDVDDDDKKRLLADPGGVLLITPESLESLFVNRPEHLGRLLGKLAYAVIDELHIFLDGERGLHLQSLLSRLRTLAPTLRQVGLSATLGDPEAARRYLAPDGPESVLYLEQEGEAKDVRFQIRGYGGEEIELDDRIAADLVRQCAGQSNLVFCNTKRDVEVFGDRCARIAKEQGLIDRFFVHHGSLSAESRQDVERIMKAGDRATAVCSSTLEMGIDIGRVKQVCQVGPPGNVASLKQRLGRSGRKSTEAQVMRVYVRCATPGDDATLLARMNLPLVQAIAAAELMLVDKWVEPPSPSSGDFSTLAQQIMSVIAQRGGVTAGDLYDTLCRRGPWRGVDTDLFARILRRLGMEEVDVIEQGSDGRLILGLTGEKLRADRAFYAAFAATRDYEVTHKGRPIGSISLAPRVGESLVLGGKRWTIDGVDESSGQVWVSPGSGGSVPVFRSGGEEVHDAVRQAMRKVLAGDAVPEYLDDEAKDLLAEARRWAVPVLADPVVALDEEETALMTWCGDRTLATLDALFELRGLKAVPETVALRIKGTVDEVEAAIESLQATPPTPAEVAAHLHPRLRRKYDNLLGDELLNESLARDAIDLERAMEVLNLA